MRRTAAGLGRMLVTLGLLILLFVVYQLWGTGIVTARAQNDLEREFNAQLRDNPTVSSTPSTTTVTATPSTTTATAPKVVQVIAPGDPVGRIRIPRIGLDLIFVEGTSRDDLSKAPGHYPASPMPGQIGNAAIAGHRTTHGAPFYDLDQLQPGDAILVDTVYGRFQYRVTRQLIVEPNAIEVVGPTPDAQLTLTTCNPRFSARQRLVIHSKLVVQNSDRASKKVPLRVVQPTSDRKGTSESLEDSLSGDTSSRRPTVVWGLIALLVGALWWWGYRHWRHPVTWLVGVAPFLVVLFAFYVYFERLLPANF